MLGGFAATQALERRLVSRQLRRVVAGLALLAAGLAAVLAADYAGSSSAQRVDRAIDGRLIARLAEHEQLTRGLVDLGDPVPIFAGTLLLVIGLVLRGRPRGALLAVLAPILASASTEWILKPLVDRTYGGWLSFPSGHATGVCAVVFVVVLLVLDQTPPRLPKWLQLIVCLGAVGLAAGVSAALVAAQDHYATDTLGGACVALATVLALGLTIDVLADRRTSR